MPGFLHGREGRRGRIGWEDDDLYLLEIKLAWKEYFPYGVMLIPTNPLFF